MTQALSKLFAWHNTLPNVPKYITFRIGIAILATILFALSLLVTRDSFASMLIAGLLSAAIAITADAPYIKTRPFLTGLYVAPLVAIVFLGGSIFMFLSKFLYEFAFMADRAGLLGLIPWNLWYCYGCAAITIFASAPYRRDEMNTSPVSSLVLNTSIALLIIQTTIFVWITNSIL